jgi:hypothetical protein
MIHSTKFTPFRPAKLVVQLVMVQLLLSWKRREAVSTTTTAAAVAMAVAAPF